MQRRPLKGKGWLDFECFCSNCFFERAKETFTKKIKRGYYETLFELVTENPKSFKNYELTEKYLNITEKNIKESPENYLWSHNRFKHKNKYEEWSNNYSPKKTKR